MNYETLPVRRFFVKNTRTDYEIECLNFDEADDILQDKREESETPDEWHMFAEVDA